MSRSSSSQSRSRDSCGSRGRRDSRGGGCSGSSSSGVGGAEEREKSFCDILKICVFPTVSFWDFCFWVLF